jgi:hypothetical protein
VMDVLVRGGCEVANFAKRSASSFPSMSVWPGTQWRVSGAERWRRALVVYSPIVKPIAVH